MAELQMKLKQYEKAERTVSQALDAENNGSQRSNDMNSLMTQVNFQNIPRIMAINSEKIVNWNLSIELGTVLHIAG